MWESPIRRASGLPTFAALIDSGGIMRARAIKRRSWSVGPMPAIVILTISPVADAGAEDQAIGPTRSPGEKTRWLMAENLKAALNASTPSELGCAPTPCVRGGRRRFASGSVMLGSRGTAC